MQADADSFLHGKSGIFALIPITTVPSGTDKVGRRVRAGGDVVAFPGTPRGDMAPTKSFTGEEQGGAVASLGGLLVQEGQEGAHGHRGRADGVDWRSACQLD
jgi:hypothetical protein